MSIYDYVVKDNKGEDVSLEKYKGAVVLIINSATECGFTPQYDELQDLYDKYKDRGFIILDFPCNQFGGQAPGTNEEIADFCSSKFNIKFPIFDKVDVAGDDAIDLFKYLVSEKPFEGFGKGNKLGLVLHAMMKKNDKNYAQNPDIKWNFTKFLVDRDGNVIERFEPTTKMSNVDKKINEVL